MSEELHRLRRSLPSSVVLLVSGRSADAYNDTLRAIGAITLHDVTSLRTVLEALRSEKRESA